MELKRPIEVTLSMTLLVATGYQATRLDNAHVAPPVIDDRALFVALITITTLLGLYTLLDIWHDHHNEGAHHE